MRNEKEENKMKTEVNARHKQLEFICTASQVEELLLLLQVLPERVKPEHLKMFH